MSQFQSFNGYYNDDGDWQRTKFCHVSCGTHCNCGPPGNVFYSSAHNKRLKKDDPDSVPKRGDETSATLGSSQGIHYTVTLTVHEYDALKARIAELETENAALRHDLQRSMSNHVADLNAMPQKGDEHG